MATGNWICFLDHDDRWLPEKLMKQVRIAKSELYDVLFTDAVIITERNRTLYSTNFDPSIVQPRDMRGEASMTPVLISLNPIVNSSVMVRAELFCQTRLARSDRAPSILDDFVQDAGVASWCE
jgi:glycosyltransferase involved in cell wall biosynthesis